MARHPISGCSASKPSGTFFAVSPMWSDLRNPDQVEREVNKPLGQRTEGQMRPTQGPVDRAKKEIAQFEMNEPCGPNVPCLG